MKRLKPLNDGVVRNATRAALLALAIALTGCATTWRVDNDVQSFSSLAAVPTPATFRFERLPSQQSTPAQQDQLEALAMPALTQVGLVRDDANARFNVQIGVQLQQLATDTWNRPYPGWWWPRTSISYSRGGPAGMWWPSYGGGFSTRWMYDGWDDRVYQRQVSVILRDAGTGQVVYETRAAHFGRWPVDKDVLPIMFSAALSGFPQPPAGLRRVNIDIPR